MKFFIFAGNRAEYAFKASQVVMEMKELDCPIVLGDFAHLTKIGQIRGHSKGDCVALFTGTWSDLKDKNKIYDHIEAHEIENDWCAINYLIGIYKAAYLEAKEKEGV